MVESLGHNVPRVLMGVFGGGTALAALAGVIGGALRVTEPSMALAVGAVVFAVIVIGGMGSLAGAFVASVLLGVLDSFAVGSDRSIADGLRFLDVAVTPETFGYAVWSVKISQVAAILPYLLLVLILIFRPKGLLGTREG
jgi:branched-chain amino acid transport system permease protein